MVELSDGAAIEAWRLLLLLKQKYSPRAHSRCVQLVLNITSSRISRVEDVLPRLERWESQVAILSLGHREILSEKLRIAFMLRILPATLQERVTGHLRHLITYHEVYGKVVSLVQSFARYNPGDAMGCPAA